MPLAVEPQRQQMKATRKEWNLPLNAPTVRVFHLRQLLQNAESLQHVFTVSSPTSRGKEKFVRSGFHMCSSIIKIHECISCQHPSAALETRRHYILLSHLNSWGVIEATSHHLTLDWSDRMLNGVPRMAQRSHGVLKDMHVMFFCRIGLVLNHPLSNGVTLSGQS